MVVLVKLLLDYRRARPLCAPLACALLLAGCWGWIPEEPVPPAEPASAPGAAGTEPPAASSAGEWVMPSAVSNPETYSVVAGDTLFSIAWRFRLKVGDLAAWNKLGDGSLILVGQSLRLTPPPGQDAASASTAAAGNGKSASGQASPSSPDPAAPPKPAASASTRAAPAGKAWAWPAQGRLDAKSARVRAGDYGVRILGQRGQNVHASDGGKVMYAGDGLKAYGLLVIVQHSPEWISAYGHNDSILVEEGEEVRSGQPIATMGIGPGNTAMLHFEIRRNGKPVEPISLLPARK